jgi:hypothetical protein
MIQGRLPAGNFQIGSLLARPEFRNARIAQQIGDANAPQTMQGILAHIQQHMQMLAQNHANTAAQQVPGAPQQKGSPALGVGPTQTPQTNPAAGTENPAQGAAVNAGSHLPAMPSNPGNPTPHH